MSDLETLQLMEFKSFSQELCSIKYHLYSNEFNY